MERSACTVLEVYRHELSIRNLSESDLRRQIVESDVRSLISTLDDSWFHFGSLMAVKTFTLQEIKSDNTKMADRIIVLLDHLVNCGETYLNFLCSLHESNAVLSKVHTLLDIVKKRKTEDHLFDEQDDQTKDNGQAGLKVTFAVDNDDNKSDTPSQTSGTASDETITFVCGCGECSIDQFLEGTVGCKNPGKSIQFPLLDTSKLDSHAQMELIDQLETEANEMDQEFSSFVTDISLSFENRNVKLGGLKVFLSTLESVKARSTIEANSMPLISFREEIQEAATIFDLFIKMTTTWSWFNDQLFEALLKKFGNEEEKVMMTAYEQKLGQFLKRHVYEMPSSIHNPSEIKGFTKFNVKLAKGIRTEKASELPKIRSRFARLLEVKSYALILTTIKEGCVELCFLVPEEVKQLFPLPHEAVNEIRNMEWMVLSVKCGDYEECIRIEEEVNPRSLLYSEAIVNETDDKQSVISGSSGVTGSVSTGVTAATRSTHHESIQSADSGCYSSSTTSQAKSGLTTVARNEMLLKKIFQHRGIHEVCYYCMLSNPTNEDLLDDMCFNTDLHDGVYPIVTVAWDEQNSIMHQIRPIPQMNLSRGFALCNGEWCKGEKCTFAHSELEKMAWNHELNRTKRAGHLPPTNRQLPVLLNAKPAPIPQQQLVHSQILLIYDPRQIMRFSVNKRDSYHVYNAWRTKFQDRLQRTDLRDEDLQVDLTVDTYQDKFYNLLCFEEMEHIKLLTKRCDGRYEFILQENVSLPKLSYENLRNVGYLNGISGHQLTYATQSSEGLVFVDHENERDICRANILSYNFSTTSKKFYISFSDDDIKELKKLLDSNKSGVFDIEFEVKHGFFNSLHKAIVNLPEHIIHKLLPRKEAFQQIILSGLKGRCKHECLRLNEECQLTALDAIVSASTRVPILVSGPFGCGKTRILARSAFEFIERSLHSGKTARILICAHHPASTQVYITKYLHNVWKADKTWKNVKIVRVTRGIFDRHSAYNEHFRNLSTFHKEVQQGIYLNERCLVVVTTYMTSLQMLNTFKNANFYTHVLLDEAAQVREPEAIAPLCLATHDAKIVIAGDRKQVGPALEVLGKQAHENGLGISLLERLEQLYLRNGYPATSYLNKLTDNYRSNKSIVHFLSSIFYDEQITTKLPIQLHHKTSFPFVFYCSDVDRVIRAPQEATFEVEANAVLAQVNFYKKGWNYSELSIIAPTRNQVNVIREKLKGALSKIKVLPTYLIQGHECIAVFLSTSEPLECNGKSKDPLKSLCNPFVFNTAISRAQSLVVAVGNPFMLLKIEAETGNSRRHCWREYLRKCLDKNAIYFQKSCLKQRPSVLSELKESLSKVSPHETGIRQKIRSTSLSSENCMVVSPIQTSPSLVSCLKQSPPKKQQTKAEMSYASAVKSGLKEAPVKINVKKMYSTKYEDEELINVSDDEVDPCQHLDEDLLSRL